VIRFLAGVRGAGKTELVGRLAERASGFVVLDMDEILDDDLGVLGVRIACGEGAPHWPAYNRLWVRVAELVARSAPLLLLGPLLPEEWRAAGGGDVAFALLDCSDDVRRERLGARGWSTPDIDDALEDAAMARAAIATRIATDGDVEVAVADVLRWLHLQDG
jgi:hypothetical protein